MSKSKKNYPDPWKVINEFGVDALRFYLMSSTIMHADNLFFNERELRDVFRKNIMLLWNVYKFYDIFASDKAPEKKVLDKLSPVNILDKWILTRLNQLIKETTKNMDSYDMPRASRPITEFIDDLSTWYVRRSRDRFKGEDEKDKAQALNILALTLRELSKIIAPFMPFIAERLWQRVTGFNFEHDKQSVHLETWPKAGEIDKKIIEEMAASRKVVELGLAKRDEEGIKVRQPLSALYVKSPKTVSIKESYIELIKDEVNVKSVEFTGSTSEIVVELDTALTPELKQEGMKRELVRSINAMRKNAGLTINDSISIYWDGGDVIRDVFKKYREDLIKDTIAVEIQEGVGDDAEHTKEVKANDEVVTLGIARK